MQICRIGFISEEDFYNKICGVYFMQFYDYWRWVLRLHRREFWVMVVFQNREQTNDCVIMLEENNDYLFRVMDG